MADQNITELPIKTNTGVSSTDYMLGIDSAEGYQILVRDVAKYIVENYNGSTIFGSAQTVKNAFAGTLNKMQVFPVNETNGRLEYLNDTTFSFANAAREWMLAKGVDAPTTADFWYLHTFAYTKDANNHVTNGKQIAYGYEVKASEVYQRTCSSGTWTDWEKQPTRAEITDLNSNLATASTKMPCNLGANITGWADYVQFGKIVLVQFVLTNASELTSNSKIVTGLPRPDRSYTIGDFKLFNSNVYFRIADDGSVVVTGNIASGANLRGAVTYIAN